MLSTGGAVATTAVACSLVFLVIGILVGAICGYRLRKQRIFKQTGSISSEPLPPPAAPVQFYDEAVTHEVIMKHNIELKENVAYGPV